MNIDDFKIKFPEYASLSSDEIKIKIHVYQFKIMYPELANLEEDLIEINLVKSFNIIKEAYWGNFYIDAVHLLTAHEISVRQLSAYISAAKLSSLRESTYIKNEGVTFEWLLKSPYLSLSMYGQRLLELRKRLPKSGFAF